MGNVKFFNKYAKDYNLICPTDASGRMLANGQLEINLFSDVSALPLSITQELTKEGGMDDSKEAILFYGTEEEDTKNTTYMNRMIMSTVVLAPSNAFNIAFWMIATLLKDKRTNVDKDKLKAEINGLIDKNAQS